MTKKETLEVLMSGNFTIRYDDNGSGVIIEGKYDDYSDTYKGEDNEPRGRTYDFDGHGDGYTPTIVELLAEALGGNTTSI